MAWVAAAVRGCLLAGGLCLALSACDEFRECAERPIDPVELPEHLSETGLYSDLAGAALAPGVRAYSPSFALWSDGADKRRFILLPDGAQIDSSDMDDWQFPVGTKLWKEFTRDGVRVETRLLHKTAPASWAFVAYVWNESGDDAVRSPEGKTNALGTAHDVPRAADCVGCHGGRKSGALGFSALQLAHETRADEIDLAELISSDRLTHAPARTPQVPGSAVQVAGLGYLHANCGHCHNQTRPDNSGPRCYDPKHSFDFVLRVGQLQSVMSTATVRTAVDGVIEPGRSAASEVVHRMQVRDPDMPSMPPLASEQVDQVGLRSVRAFIDSL